MRIVVMGQAGAGKTTVARELAARLGVPHIELDAHQHLPGWEANPRLRADVVAALDAAADGWVVDGNYLVLREVVLARAGTVLWLDYPRRLTTYRVARRTWRRLRSREVLWNGNVESWRNLADREHPIYWTFTTAGRHRVAYPRAFAAYPKLTVVRVRRPRDLRAALRGIG